MDDPWPNDPADDGNALRGAFFAGLFSVALALVVVALMALFRWLL